MISLATLVMIGWIPLILVSFSLLTPRKAVITAYIVGWMFLPILSWNLPGLPVYDKTTATNLGVFAGIALFDTQQLLRFRLKAVDLPLIALCAAPMGTSLANGLGVYDGLAGVWGETISWALPWVIGGCYFGSLPALRSLATGIFIGALVYIPLCLYEMAAGPILHLKLYGYYQHDPGQALRADGTVRPMVFMRHGLMLSMWLGSSAIAGLALSRDAIMPRIPGAAKLALALVLIATTLLSRSIGASALMLLGITIWLFVRSTRMGFPMALLLVAIPSYMALRGTGVLDVSALTSTISSGVQTAGLSPAEAAARLESARVRFEAEDRLLERVREAPVFGISGYSFNLYVDRTTGEVQTITTDGFWTIQLCTRGIFGLSAWVALMLLPVLLFLRRHPIQAWRLPIVATGGALALVLLLYTVDCLQNANINPVYTLIGGGMAGLPALSRAVKRKRPVAAGVLQGTS